MMDSFAEGKFTHSDNLVLLDFQKKVAGKMVDQIVVVGYHSRDQEESALRIAKELGVQHIW